MKSTANDTLDVNAALLPFKLRVSKVIHHAAIRLTTLPRQHPLAKHVKKAANRYFKKHCTTLHEMLHAFNLKPGHMEKIEVAVIEPKGKPTFDICIPKNKKAVVLEDRMCRASVTIYTDGSAIDDGVGAAVVLYWGGEEIKAACRHLGSIDEHTAFETELLGAAMDGSTDTHVGTTCTPCHSNGQLLEPVRAGSPGPKWTEARMIGLRLQLMCCARSVIQPWISGMDIGRRPKLRNANEETLGYSG
jgi:hypothetical protein